MRWILLLAAAGCAAAQPAPLFTDVTAAAGIRFKHNAGKAGKKWLPETMGSGCAFFDADVRWLAHYGFRPLDMPTLFGGLSS